MMGYPFVTHGFVKSLDVGFLLHLSWLDEIDTDGAFAAQVKVTALVYSRLLLHRKDSGLPRHSMIRSSERIARSGVSEKSTVIPRNSRLQSSITLNSRMLRPSESRLCMKSIDQL